TSFRLPGLGAYMSVAIEAGNMRAILSGILAMMSVILVMDILVWRPVLAWVYKFRLEDLPGAEQEPPFVELLLRDSILFRYALLLRARRPRLRTQRIKWVQVFEKMSGHWHRFVRAVRLPWALVLKVLLGFLVMTLIAAVLRLSVLLKDLTGTEWLEIAYAVLMTGLRVVVCLILASIWTVPLGIWLGQDQKRIRWAQPIVQIAASFPAPMLFPLALGVLFILRIPFGIGSIFLMMIGVQWYILFNVLAGALRISAELQQVANLMNISKIDKWRYLYLPSVFPTLVTGWVNAAGGAWNASIVAEYASYKGERLITTGVGATISKAASEADFPRLAAALLVMVVTLVLINRTVWSRVYRLTSERYRMES
ncbi:MAG: ABC transporter permease subunit, partial [Pseudobdellovibrionaceae bacterium]